MLFNIPVNPMHDGIGGTQPSPNFQESSISHKEESANQKDTIMLSPSLCETQIVGQAPNYSLQPYQSRNNNQNKDARSTEKPVEVYRTVQFGNDPASQ